MNDEDINKSRDLSYSNKTAPFINDETKCFQNKKCTFYPCHDVEGLNCLFCFCPLYYMKDCGGNWTYCNGIKDCSLCVKTHGLEGYDYVMNKIMEYNDDSRHKDK